jgi:hypothetical protein
VCSYLFSVKILSPQNGGFIRAFWLVPDSCSKEFRAVAGSAKLQIGFFFQQSLHKQLIISRLEVEKGFLKEKKCPKTHSSGFLRK